MSTYRVAIIGAGPRGEAHAEASARIEGAALAACADPVAERREKLAGRFGMRAYADAAEMLERERPALVHVTTPPGARVEVMRLVSEVGVPACTVEKPIALGVADWRALVELSQVTRTKFAVSHQFRWYPSLRRCREALASGALGRVLLVEATVGMNITNQGTHALHYGNSLNGDRRVASVFGAAAGLERQDVKHPGPKHTVGSLAFDNGVRMLWNTGPTAPRVGDPSTTWQHVRVAAYAEAGRVLWEEFGRWEIAGPSGVEQGTFGGRDAWAANNLLAQEAFHRDMLAWMADDAKPAGTHLERSLHEWKAVLALYESALSRRPVDLATFEPALDLMERLDAALGEG